MFIFTTIFRKNNIKIQSHALILKGDFNNHLYLSCIFYPRNDESLEIKVKNVVDISKLVIKDQEADGYLETLNFLNGDFRSESEFIEGMLKTLCFLYKSPDNITKIIDIKEDLTNKPDDVEIKEYKNGVYSCTHKNSQEISFGIKEYFDYHLGCLCNEDRLNSETRIKQFYELNYKKIFKHPPTVNRNAVYFDSGDNRNPKVKLSLYQYYSMDYKKNSYVDTYREVKYYSFNDLQREKFEKEYLKKRKIYEAIFKDKLSNMTKDEYVLESDYVNLFHPVRIKHNYCQSTEEYTPHDFLIGKRCSYCSRKLKVEDVERLIPSVSRPKMIFGGFVDDPNYPEDTIRLHLKDELFFTTVYAFERPVYMTLRFFLQELSRHDGSNFIKTSIYPEESHDYIYKRKEELEDEKNKERKK